MDVLRVVTASKLDDPGLVDPDLPIFDDSAGT
jgi:hypothetical protein